MAPRYSIDTSKTTQYSEAWVVLVVLLTLAGLILRAPILTTAAALLLAVSLAAWGWNRFSLRGLSYTRRLSETRAFPGEQITLTLEVSNRKPLPLTWLVARDSFPTALPVDGEPLTANPATNLADFTTFWMPGPRQRLRRSVQITCARRGHYRFGPARLETGDGFGFFESRRSLPAETRLIVYPRLLPLDLPDLPTRHPFGARPSRSPLHADPLRPAGVREYLPDDDLRRIHWKATARRGALYTRLDEPSDEPQVVILLNVTTMPRHWQGVDLELHERAVEVAASLAARALAGRIPTGLIANGAVAGGDQPLRLRPGRSERQLLQILELLAAVTHFATAPIEEVVEVEAARLPRTATLVVVSALAHPPLLAALEQAGARGRRVVLADLAPQPPPPLPGVEVWRV